MERYYAALRAAVDAHGGTVVKLLGDGVMAAFGVPRVAEDDAHPRRARRASAMQEAFRELVARAARGGRRDRPARRGQHRRGRGQRRDATDVIGDPVNVAARLQEEARDGDVRDRRGDAAAGRRRS